MDGAPTNLGGKHICRAADRAKGCFGHAAKRSRRLRARKKTGAREKEDGGEAGRKKTGKGKGKGDGRRRSEGVSATEPESTICQPMVNRFRMKHLERSKFRRAADLAKGCFGHAAKRSRYFCVGDDRPREAVPRSATPPDVDD